MVDTTRIEHSKHGISSTQERRNQLRETSRRRNDLVPLVAIHAAQASGQRRLQGAQAHRGSEQAEGRCCWTWGSRGRIRGQPHKQCPPPRAHAEERASEHEEQGDVALYLTMMRSGRACGNRFAPQIDLLVH